MSISSGNYEDGDAEADLEAQLQASRSRTLEPADPVEFMKWVQQTVRDHGAVLEKMVEEHGKLVYASDLATIGLKRLESYMLVEQRPKLDYLESVHRNFVQANKGIGYILENCQQTIRETITNYSMVAESLRSPLADRHKKVAIQKELGLRLADLDASANRCKIAIEGQITANRQLSQAIQALLSETGLKLPPQVKEDANREDEIARIALNLKKTLVDGKDAVNYVPYDPSTEAPIQIARLRGGDRPDIIHLGDTASDPTTSATVSVVGAGAALVVGAIFGVLILRSIA